MKVIYIVLTAVLLVGCKQHQSRNKMVLPEDNGHHYAEHHEDNGHKNDAHHESKDDSHAKEDSHSTNNNQAKSTAGQLDASGNYVYNVGDMVDVELPGGEKLHVGNQSTEFKLFSFLNNASSAVSEDKSQGWITLDRVYFQTASDQLTTNSQEQVNRIGQILKAFPTAELKLGGYTDNSGSQKINQPLSEGRAKSVMNQLVSLGTTQNRLSAEGYGAEHPICAANDTPECMAQNRRVDIRVTKK